MLSEVQKADIVARVLKAFERQFGVKRNASDMSLVLDKPNKGYLCSIFVTSNKDPLKFKLNLKRMDVVTSLTSFRNSQLENYSPGMADEVYVADLELNKREYVAFYNYLKSDKFKKNVDDVDYILDDEGVAVVSEDGSILVFEDEGV